MIATQGDAPAGEGDCRAAARVSQLRLHALRLVYTLIAVVLLSRTAAGLGEPVEVVRSVTRSLFAGVGVLAILGLRYPLQMLPLMLFEAVWKAAWLGLYGFPRLMRGELTPTYSGTFGEVAIGLAIVLVVLPYGYLLEHYIRRAGNPWRG